MYPVLPTPAPPSPLRSDAPTALVTPLRLTGTDNQPLPATHFSTESYRENGACPMALIEDNELLDIDAYQPLINALATWRPDPEPTTSGLDAAAGHAAELNQCAADLLAAWGSIKTALEVWERSPSWQRIEKTLPAWHLSSHGRTTFKERIDAPLERFISDPWFALCLRSPETMAVLRPRLIAWCAANARHSAHPEISMLYQEAVNMLAEASFDDLIAHPRLRGILIGLQNR